MVVSLNKSPKQQKCCKCAEYEHRPDELHATQAAVIHLCSNKDTSTLQSFGEIVLLLRSSVKSKTS